MSATKYVVLNMIDGMELTRAADDRVSTQNEMNKGGSSNTPYDISNTSGCIRTLIKEQGPNFFVHDNSRT